MSESDSETINIPPKKKVSKKDELAEKKRAEMKKALSAGVESDEDIITVVVPKKPVAKKKNKISVAETEPTPAPEIKPEPIPEPAPTPEIKQPEKQPEPAPCKPIPKKVYVDPASFLF